MKKTDKQEILEAIQGVEQGLSKKIDGVEHKLSDQIDLLAVEVHGVKDDVKGLKGDVQELKEDLRDMHSAMDAFSSETDRSLASIKALMVTKDYLDVKFVDQRTDIVNQVKRKIPEWVKTCT